MKGGAAAVTEADFVGAKEVRINKMKGFTASDYKRNEDNKRSKIDVAKETFKLEKERWFGYDLDTLDQSENASYEVQALVEEHTRLIAIPEKDRVAVQRLLEAAFAEATDDDSEGKYVGKTVKETITTENSLASYDAAEAYMTDAEIVGPFIMFASTDYYSALKNAKGVSKTFTTNEQQISGINRKVAQLDGSDTIKKINYILVPLMVCSPVEKYNSIDLIPASQDRDGYRDTIKGLNYYDAIVTEKARPAIYVSYDSK